MTRRFIRSATAAVVALTIATGAPAAFAADTTTPPAATDTAAQDVNTNPVVGSLASAVGSAALSTGSTVLSLGSLMAPFASLFAFSS